MSRILLAVLLLVACALFENSAHAQQCSMPTWGQVFPLGHYRWDVVRVTIPAGNISVTDEITYRPSGGSKACWVMYDEFNGNPPNGTRYSISNAGQNFRIKYTLPCGEGHISTRAVGAAVGAAISTYYGGNPQIGGAVGSAVGAAIASDCGVGGPRSWLDAQWAFIIVDSGRSCPAIMPCHHRPWIDVR